MEVPQTAYLPTIDEAFGPSMRPRSLGHVVGNARGERVPSIVVAVAIVDFDVGTVRDYGPVLADLVERVRPSIGELRVKPMPGAQPVDGLESIVVGCPDAVFLKDIAGIGVLESELTGVINVQHDVQLASLTTHISNLENGGIAQALFHLEAVIVEIGSAEVLVDGVSRKDVCAAVVSGRLSGDVQS